MKKLTMVLLLAISMVLIVAGTISAAESTVPVPQHLEMAAMEKIMQQRGDMQAKRIQDGVTSGRLTKMEHTRLQSQLDKIKQDFLTMKSDATPGLTPKEFGKVQRDLNKNSADIYRLKHNQHNRNKVGKQ